MSKTQTDPRIAVVGYNLFALEVGFSRLDLMEYNLTASRREPWEARAVDYLRRYDAEAASKGLS